MFHHHVLKATTTTWVEVARVYLNNHNNCEHQHKQTNTQHTPVIWAPAHEELRHSNSTAYRFPAFLGYVLGGLGGEGWQGVGVYCRP